MLELARKSFYLATILVVLCTMAMSIGRLVSMYPAYVQEIANARLIDQGIEISGLESSWRFSNPIIEIDRIQLPEGIASNVVIEVAIFESLLRNQFVARRLLIEELDLDIALTVQQAEFDFLKLIDQIQTNFEWIRHTDELTLSAILTLRRDLAHQRLNMNLQAVNQGGMHRYRAKVWQESQSEERTVEFVADAVDTLLDIRTGDYQMSLSVNGLALDLPLLTGNSRLPHYIIDGHAEWERVRNRVQGNLEIDIAHIDRIPLNAHIETSFVQHDDEPTRFKTRSAWFQETNHTVKLPDVVFAIGDDSLFGSTYNVQLQELVPIAADFVTSGENNPRWPNGIALRGTFQRYEFLIDSNGFHWYAEGRDILSNSFENLPHMKLETGFFFGNSNQIALGVSNSPGELFIDSHFQSPWYFASSSGLAIADIRNEQVGLHMRDFSVHTASDDSENLDTQLDVSSLLRRGGAEIQINELIHEPVSATFRGSIRNTRGNDVDYRVALLIESRNTLLPIHQVTEFIPSNLVEDLTHWRKQYVESASFFGTRVAYMTFRDNVFAQNQREMSIDGQFTNGSITYQSEWPRLTNLGGSWSIKNDNIIVMTDRVTVQNTELGDAVARFPLDSDEPFRVTFAATAKTQDLLDFVQASDLKTLIPAIDASWSGAGLVSIEADLAFPRIVIDNKHANNAPRSRDFRVSFEMHDTSLYMPNLDMEFHELNGLAEWRSPYNLKASLTRGRFFDEPMDAEIVSRHRGEQPVIEFHAHSRINADNALKIAGLTEIETGSGITEFEAQLRVFPGSKEGTELIVSTDLSGIEFETLETVSAQTKASNPSELRFEFQQDRTEVEILNPDVRGWITLAGTPTSILEGAIALGQRAEVPAHLPGQLHLSGELESWVYSTGDAVRLEVPITLSEVSIDRFTAFDHEFTDAMINGSYSTDHLDVTVQSSEFDGTIVKPAGDTTTKIHATQLRWTLMDGTVNEDLLDVSVMSQVEPTVVSIDELLLRTQNEDYESWGQWQFTMSPQEYGVEISDLTADTRGLRIETLSPIKWDSATNVTEFDGRIYGDNLGTILEAWDFDASVESEEFEVNANIQWSGSPLAIDIANSSGQFQARASNGRFVEIDQGGDVFRLVSLLNFSKILNRLALDFRDVTQQGLHYDTASMDVNLDNGVLSFIEPLRIDGPSARLRIEGQVDTASGELNNELTVRIPLHKGIQTYAAYLAATNPPLTVALLLSTLLISEPIKALFTVRYDLTGDLNNPILTRVGVEPPQTTQVATP